MNFEFEVILDGGHGWNTPGKRSPFKTNDGRSLLRENEFNDAMVNKLSYAFWTHGIRTHIVSSESNDTPLNDRVTRANILLNKIKSRSNIPVFISIHADAYSLDESVNGSRIFYQQIVNGLTQLELNRRSLSKKFAEELSKSFNDCIDVKKAKPMPGNFKIIREVNCIAILIEHAFMTNKKDLQQLLSDFSRNQWTENTVLCTISKICEIGNS